MKSETEYLTLLETVKFLKISKGTIYRLLSARRLPHYRLGKLYRFKKSDLESWVDTKRGDTNGDTELFRGNTRKPKRKR